MRTQAIRPVSRTVAGSTTTSATTPRRPRPADLGDVRTAAALPGQGAGGRRAALAPGAPDQPTRPHRLRRRRPGRHRARCSRAQLPGPVPQARDADRPHPLRRHGRLPGHRQDRPDPGAARAPVGRPRRQGARVCSRLPGAAPGRHRPARGLRCLDPRAGRRDRRRREGRGVSRAPVQPQGRPSLSRPRQCRAGEHPGVRPGLVPRREVPGRPGRAGHPAAQPRRAVAGRGDVPRRRGRARLHLRVRPGDHGVVGQRGPRRPHLEARGRAGADLQIASFTPMPAPLWEPDALGKDCSSTNLR